MDDVDKVLEPFTYIHSIPGKGVRDILCNGLNLWILCSNDDLEIIKEVIGILHNASLVIDDIEDGSLTRRGKPAAHVTFGVPRSLNAANYAYFLAMNKLAEIASKDMLDIYCEEMLKIHLGQGQDILWRELDIIANENEYREMVLNKTGGLFRLAARLMMKKTSFTLREKHPAIINFLNELAVFFQIRDDLLNLLSSKFHQQKGFCEDISEGKYSFMVLYALRTCSLGGELKSILKKRTMETEEINRAVEILMESGAIGYSLTYLIELGASLHIRIKNLGENALLSQLIHKLLKEIKNLERSFVLEDEIEEKATE